MVELITYEVLVGLVSGSLLAGAALAVLAAVVRPR
jgi:hypothetical protein